MSADNGVYILATMGANDEPEYRVAHTQAIEGIWWSEPIQGYDRTGLMDRDRVVLEFGRSRVHTDPFTAMTEAVELFNEWMQDVGVVEYGIKVLDHREESFPVTSASAS